MADLKYAVSADEFGASISNETGADVVSLQRLGRWTSDGAYQCLSDSLLNVSGQSAHATTDAEWQSIIDLISAAPEMLACLRALRQEISSGAIHDAGNDEGWVREIVAVLAKAEPQRTVKHRLNVVVAVEVEAPAGTHPDAIKNHAFDSVYHTGGTVRDGGTVKFVSKAVTTVGELYEE